MLKLTLMKHTFEVPCEPDEKERLIEAATLLEEKLDEVKVLKGESKVLSVALNMCYDYLQMKEDTNHYHQHLDNQIERAIQLVAEAPENQPKH